MSGVDSELAQPVDQTIGEMNIRRGRASDDLAHRLARDEKTRILQAGDDVLTL